MRGWSLFVGVLGALSCVACGSVMDAPMDAETPDSATGEDAAFFDASTPDTATPAVDAGTDAAPEETDAGRDAGALRDTSTNDAEAPDATIDTASPATALVRVHYDTGVGNRITLRGSGAGLTWESGIDCTWSDGNVWLCAVEAAAEVVELKPLFNDEAWSKGPNWRLAPGATLDVYPFFFATHGRLVTHASFRSEMLDNTRDVYVYLPPSYDENETKTYPVLVMNDGGNLFDPSRSFGGVAWEIDAAVDSLATSSAFVEPIVVGVSATAARMVEYTPSVEASVGEGGGADAYLAFVVDEVLPFVRDNYRTSGERAGIAGSSLGGLVSMYGCWTRTEDFDRCGVFSPSLWWDDQYMIERVRDDAAGAAEKALSIYLDSGDSGTSRDGMADAITMRDLLISKGYVLGSTLQYELGEGDSHNETAWAKRAPGALAFLYRDADRVAE